MLPIGKRLLLKLVGTYRCIIILFLHKVDYNEKLCHNLACVYVYSLSYFKLLNVVYSKNQMTLNFVCKLENILKFILNLKDTILNNFRTQKCDNFKFYQYS